MTPKPIRNANGRVPLTKAQRAKIKTVDLDNPPPFVRVLRAPADLRYLTQDAELGVTSWVYRPDWGDAAALFDCQKPTKGYGTYRLFDQQPACKPSYAYDVEDFHEALPLRPAQAFTDKLSELCNRFREGVGGSAHARIEFESATVLTDVHQDVFTGMRAICALNYGNVLLPDVMMARARGFNQQADTQGMRPAVYAADLLAAGVDLYSTQLGDITFVAGKTVVPPTWHAAFGAKLSPKKPRKVLKVEFSLDPYKLSPSPCLSYP